MTNAERLAALEDAYYSGHRKVQLDGQSIEYQSAADMWAAIVRLQNLINASVAKAAVVMRPTMYDRGRR